MADPSVETWRATLGQSTSAQLRQMTDEASELTRLLLEARQALIASQQDLTAMQAKRDALVVLNAELKVEAAHWRATAGRHLANLDETARALATANHQNRILTAENEAALRRLNEAAGQAEKLRGYWQECSRHRDQLLAERDRQVSDRDAGMACSSCTGPIVRGQAYQPLADAKGLFAHVACPIKEEP